MPLPIFGTFFAKRMAIAAFIGAALTVARSRSMRPRGNSDRRFPHTRASLLCRRVGVRQHTVHRPDARAMPTQPDTPLRVILQQPLRDASFRAVLIFTGWWNFAVNFAAPFFAVYMLRDLGLSMLWVMRLSISQPTDERTVFSPMGRNRRPLFEQIRARIRVPHVHLPILNLAVYRNAGQIRADNSAAVRAIHVMAGISTAGVTLCTGNLAFKFAPYGKATAYLAVNALVSGVMATVAPILAGLMADYFFLEKRNCKSPCAGSISPLRHKS